MENTINEMIIAPMTGQIISKTAMGLDVPEFIEAEEVFENKNHPNFIESNTQAITLDALKDQLLYLLSATTPLQSPIRILLMWYIRQLKESMEN